MWGGWRVDRWTEGWMGKRMEGWGKEGGGRASRRLASVFTPQHSPLYKLTSGSLALPQFP